MESKKATPKKWAGYYDQESILEEILEESVTLTLDEDLLQDIVASKRKRKLKTSLLRWTLFMFKRSRSLLP